MTRVCTVCKQVFSATIEYFYACKRVQSGLQAKCKKCYNKTDTNYKRTALKKQVLVEKTLYSDMAYKYADKIIDYADSPTGKAYIGLVKGCLMKNDNNIGFKGVLVQSDDRALVQCYECGEWFRAIRGNHLMAKHNITVYEYKKRYGFSYKFSLDSDCTYDKVMLSVNRDLAIRVATLDNNRHKVPEPPHNKREITMSFMGEHKTCPDQLKETLCHYIHRFKKLPRRNVKHNTILLEPYLNRFGSLSGAFKAYGLPTREVCGQYTFYRFKDGTVYKYNKLTNNLDDLYEVLMKKCSILSEFTL